MSTAVIIVIAAVVAVVVLGLAVMPSMRRRQAERQLDERRDQRVDLHKREATESRLRADLAEQEAAQSRAEADAHATRAQMHERGLADEDLQREPRIDPGDRESFAEAGADSRRAPGRPVGRDASPGRANDGDEQGHGGEVREPRNVRG